MSSYLVYLVVLSQWGIKPAEGKLYRKTYQHVAFDLSATFYSFGNAKIENQGGVNLES